MVYGMEGATVVYGGLLVSIVPFATGQSNKVWLNMHPPPLLSL